MYTPDTVPVGSHLVSARLGESRGVGHAARLRLITEHQKLQLSPLWRVAAIYKGAERIQALNGKLDAYSALEFV